MSGLISPQSFSCAEAEELLMLRLYDELPPGQSAALDRHLASCENCRRELASLRALEETLSLAPPPGPSAELLNATRLRVRAALDAESEKVARRWFPVLLPAGIQTLRAAPFAAAAMLLAGVGIGSISGYQYALQRRGIAEPVQVIRNVAQEGSPIASVGSVAPQPDGKSIMVSYNRLVPESATGSTDDPFIRRVLAMGVQSPTSPSVQDDSVRLLADSCQHGPRCDDTQVRYALMTAARYDGDPALRSQALGALEPYIAQDTRVRDAVLESVMSDASPDLRAQAIRMLSPVEADSSVRQVLHNASMSDQDPQIRTMSRNMSREALDIGLQIQ